MGPRLCKLSFRSLRDLFLLLILIAVLSSMMTLHMSSYLPWLQSQPELKVHVDGHLNIYRSLQLSQKREDGSRKRLLFHGRKKMSEEHRALVARLLQLEEQSLPLKTSPIVILAEGSLSAVKHEVPLLESAFSQLGAKVKFKVIEDSDNKDDNVDEDMYATNKPTWRVLMCLNTSRPNTCRDTGQHLDQRDFQRMNVIPALHALLFDPQVMCQGVGSTGQWQGGPLPCYKLLEDVRALPSSQPGDKSGGGCGERTMWVLHAGRQGGQPSIRECEELKQLTKGPDWKAGVAVKLPPRLFHVGVQPLMVQFHVLVMSFSPLRLYLHSEALTWEGISSYLSKKPQRSLTLGELQQLMRDSRGHQVSMDQLEEAIVDALLLLESADKHLQDQTHARCHSCFQLLEVATVFNTSFHPFILQIKPYTHTGKMASLNEYLVRQRILEDLAAMLVARDTVVMDIAKGLGELGLTNLYNEGVCNSDQSFCLSKGDLIFSLNNRREQLHHGSFIKLYPSTAAVKYTHLLQAVNQDGDEVDDIEGATDQHSSTVELHSYLLSLESYFAHMEEEETIEAYDDMNVPIDFDGITSAKSSARGPNITEVQSRVACDNDPASMPYLVNIVTKPSIDLMPEFSPLTTEYRAVVGYDMLLITVWAFAKSCSSQARLEDKHGNKREANFTLGIGENRISIYVVDMSHADPWVLNTYTLIIERQGPDYQQTSFLPGLPHQVCSLTQDCSLRFLKTSSCGLKPVYQERSWARFMEKMMSLPQCQDGDVKGQWYVPCTDCNDSPSCYWKQALWQPDTCSYKWLPRGKVQQCFAGKKVLFIGDSTNRGIMHYISERVNNTLLEWDKTHHLKVYNNLNNNTTTFSFAYYPQFWLPAEHRPVFDKALFQLIKKNSPLENSTKTVLVIGGVHWLAKHHIDVVIKALRREGLTGVQLVVKGLGAGFHQPVSGVHCLSQKEQQRFLSHNQATLKYARQSGFSIVDTFNMTMARYRDFLQGKCACHFHRVSMTKTSYNPSNAVGSKHSLSSSYSESSQTVYHVEGEINAVYSEMLISQICGPS
ncbi:cadherin-like and PC-esterase domain-containing protein 1 [Haliotis cracherodii]|uniref:cadherin-like and PC-esterase domain-containing protein 1 n=1 Tax=Haliotis cracherodii TaxID=6455 RepID=UPI0039E890A1